MAQSNIIRYFSLFILTFQNAATVLVMRYSRKQTDGKDLYIGTTLILISEIVKLGLCILLLIYQKSGSLILTWRAITSEVFFKPWETAKLAIPSSLYTLQNNLNVFALSFLDAATYQVTYQLKILTTAFFAVILLRKELRPLQWLSLIILMAGVILVQFPSGSKSKENELSDDENSTINYWHLIGLLAVLASSFSSGFAGVYYEKLLKESSQPSVIIRNIQLGIFSIIFATAGVLLNDLNKVVRRGFFSGYTDVVWLVIMLQATGGLVVAAVIKYADNILKGFATSVSIIISCLISYVVFNDLNLNLTFILGTGLVMCATFLYGIQSHQPSTGPIQIISSNTSRSPKMLILSPPHPIQDDLVSVYQVEKI